MPSTYTVSHRFELQASGENLNSWGQRLNSALTRIDAAVAGIAVIVLAGATYTLSTSNTLTDEARMSTLDVSGVGGCTIVIPSVAKLYWVRNGSSGDVAISTGVGPVAVLAVNDVARVWCDGVSVYTPMIGGVSYKAYVDATAFAALTASFPGQAGNAGKFLQTNGVTPAWVLPTIAGLPDYATSVKGFAIAMALTF